MQKIEKLLLRCKTCRYNFNKYKLLQRDWMSVIVANKSSDKKNIFRRVKNIIFQYKEQVLRQKPATHIFQLRSKSLALIFGHVL